MLNYSARVDTLVNKGVFLLKLGQKQGIFEISAPNIGLAFEAVEYFFRFSDCTNIWIYSHRSILMCRKEIDWSIG